jgi:hypothetical protein
MEHLRASLTSPVKDSGTDDSSSPNFDIEGTSSTMKDKLTEEVKDAHLQMFLVELGDEFVFMVR